MDVLLSSVFLIGKFCNENMRKLLFLISFCLLVSLFFILLFKWNKTYSVFFIHFFLIQRKRGHISNLYFKIKIKICIFVFQTGGASSWACTGAPPSAFVSLHQHRCPWRWAGDGTCAVDPAPKLQPASHPSGMEDEDKKENVSLLLSLFSRWRCNFPSNRIHLKTDLLLRSRVKNVYRIACAADCLDSGWMKLLFWSVDCIVLQMRQQSRAEASSPTTISNWCLLFPRRGTSGR